MNGSTGTIEKAANETSYFPERGVFMKHLLRYTAVMGLLSVSLSGQTFIPGNTALHFGGSGRTGTLESDDLYRYEHRVIIGESVVGTVSMESGHLQSSLGQFSFYLKRPSAIRVQPSAGDYPDRITVTWGQDVLDPPALNGYRIHRDGEYLSPARFGEEYYSDSNVYPGQVYEYSIIGRNSYGWGPAGVNTGFVNPNGRITGHIKTKTHGNPVPNVEVSLSPYIGSSLLFSGSGDHVELRDLSEEGDGTLEMWFRAAEAGSVNGLFLNGRDNQRSIELSIEDNTRLSAGIYSGGWHRLTSVDGSVLPGTWNHAALTWDAENTLCSLYLNGHPVSAAENCSPEISTGHWVLGAGIDNSGTVLFSGNIDEVRVWSSCLDSAAIARNMHRVVDSHEKALTAEWRFDEASGDKAFDNSVNSHDIQIGGTVWSQDIPDIHNSAFTDLQGNYEISSINYGLGTSFKVAAHKALHAFEQDTQVIALDLTAASVNNVNFLDISQVAVTGYVQFGTQAYRSGCFARDISFYTVNGEGDTVAMVPPVETDEDGYFAAEFEPGSSPTIIPRYGDHEFIPQFMRFENLLDDQARKDFYDFTTRDLGVYFHGGEFRVPLCEAEVTVTPVSECMEPIVDTMAANGFINIGFLPPQRYKVTVRPLVSLYDVFRDPETRALEGVEVNLTDMSDTLEFVYYAPLQVDISGLDTSYCEGKALLKQNSPRDIKIQIFEEYRGQIKYLSTGDIIIVDEISDRDQEIRIHAAVADSIEPNQRRLEDMPVYTLNPGMPNIASPYTKNLLVTVTDDRERVASRTIKAVVEGHRPRESTFVTRFPDLPFYILRDPPGDMSYAELIESSSMSSSWSVSSINTDFNDNYINYRAGTKFSTGVGYSTETEIWTDISDYFAMQVDVNETSEWEFTLITTEAFRTSADDIIVGEDGDVFIGGGLNITYGVSDALSWDRDECKAVLSRDIVMAPNGFDTFFAYSSGYIRNHLIPSLYTLRTAEDSLSALEWEDILFRNDSLKQAAVFIENRSFNGGAGYTYTVETEQRSTVSYRRSQWIHNELAVEVGFLSSGSGGVDKYRNIIDITTGSSKIETEKKQMTVRYHLEDDDPEDYFSVNIYADPVYTTPVFKLVSGTSSAPWEAGTQKRDMPELTVSPSIVTGLNIGEEAVLTLTMANVSESEDTREYHLRALNEYNPQGAQLSVNGTALGDGVISYSVPFGQSFENMLTLKRGPSAYSYDSLALILYPPSEYENWEAGGGPIDAGLIDTAWFSVHFIEPCTDPAFISWPVNDWVLTSADSFMTVTLEGFEKNDSSLEKLELQYSYHAGLPSGGEAADAGISVSEQVTAAGIIKGGASFPEALSRGYSISDPVTDNEVWITSVMLDREALDSLSESRANILWESFYLMDGDYDVRVKTSCISGTEYYSDAISGHIDNNPPRILGTAHPVDGVLNSDDEIALYFEELIDGNSVDANNIWCWNVTDPGWVDVDFTSYENGIVLRPRTENLYIENCRLRAMVKGVRDFYGNTLPDSIVWEFTVDRNPVHWNQSAIKGVNIMGEGGSMEISLRNTGMEASLYEFSSDPWYLNRYLTALPEWLTAAPGSGQLNPGGITQVKFSLSPMLNFGVYEETVYAHTSSGDEPLTINVRSLCPPPHWVKDYSDYSYSMSVTAAVSVRGELSRDSYDYIGAFIDNENCGYAGVEEVVLNDSVSTYLAFLDIHSNVQSAERISFRIWDASECEEYYDVPVNIPFTSNGIAGSPADPLLLEASGAVAQVLRFREGWNWFSIHLDNSDSSLLTVSEAFSHEGQFSSQDRVIDQIGNEIYSSRSHSWLPGTMTLDPASMYMAHFLDSVEALVVGYEINPDSLDITLQPGWNWLGYPLRYAHKLNEALINLHPGDGATIKSESGFAEYVEDWGLWVGSLAWMTPGHGYLLKSTKDELVTFTYEGVRNPSPPAAAVLGKEAALTDLPSALPSELYYNSGQYPQRMTVTAEIRNPELRPETTLIYAVSGDSIRAVSQAQYFPELKEWRYFLNVSGHGGETVELRLLDVPSGTEYQADPVLYFDAGSESGRFLHPLTVEKGSAVIPDDFYLSQNYPNPFNPITYIEFGLPEKAPVSIAVYDLAGRRVRELLNSEISAGRHRIAWNALNEQGSKVASGVYFIVFKTETLRFHKKMVYLK